MLALDGIEVVPEHELHAQSKSVFVDWREGFKYSHGRLYHASNVVNTLGIKPALPTVQFFLAERSTGTEVNQDDPVVRFDQNIARMKVSVKKQILKIIEASNELNAARENNGVNI